MASGSAAANRVRNSRVAPTWFSTLVSTSLSRLPAMPPLPCGIQRPAGPRYIAARADRLSRARAQASTRTQAGKWDLPS